MASEVRTIVVCGATGKQGGAVVNSLLKAGGWNVVAIARNPEGAPAQALSERGVEIRQADLLDGPSLTRAFEGAYGVFGVTTPLTPKGKIDTEQDRRHGFNIADACAATGVQHLVLSTVLYINDAQRAVPYVQSKQTVEEYVITSGTPFTFLRPASFMDEIGGEFLPVKKDVITGQADGDAKVPYIACQDIGRFARLAFDDHATFRGRKLNLVGDFLSGDELAEVLTRVYGRPHRHKVPPRWLMWIFAREWMSLRRQFEEWGREPHPEVMLQAVEESRRLLPEMLTFEGYLRTERHDLATP